MSKGADAGAQASRGRLQGLWIGLLVEGRLPRRYIGIYTVEGLGREREREIYIYIYGYLGIYNNIWGYVVFGV